jgi:Bacterial sugar transferase
MQSDARPSRTPASSDLGVRRNTPGRRIEPGRCRNRRSHPTQYPRFHETAHALGVDYQRYALIEGWQRRRLAVKPGMTGLWQIFGSSRVPMHDMVKIDYKYGANWSIWLDLKILLRTIPHVLRRRGL